MAWVWWDRADVDFKVQFDMRSPIHISNAWRLKPVDIGDKRGLYHTNATIARLEKLHCPYVENQKPPIVDDLWREIILQYVSGEKVSFIPLEVRCKDAVSYKYWWVNAHESVRCIDVERSDIYSKIEKDERIFIFGVDLYVHRCNCLSDGTHLAFDEQMSTHLVLSDQLRDALAATGESAMFYRAEDLPIGRIRSLH